jgi:NADPH-dependent glutamate synthase beta subunit-like oxidoreductase
VEVLKIDKIRTAPCQEACPAGIDVPRYIRFVRAGRFDAALAVIRERIPFPFVCGFACTHPCEAKCARSQLEEPVSIRKLKRVAAERGWKKQIPPPRAAPSGKQAAILGAGPCGLTAAWYLAIQGHAVTVFEALEKAGGMLRYGIPGYRLPEEILDRDIAFIERCGVKIVTRSRVASAEGLLDQGFEAVLAATGAWRPLKLGIPGEASAGVMDGLFFLKAVNGGGRPFAGGSVAVVGGGNTAIDAARAARRLGAEVRLLYRRTRAEMPAAAVEIEEALEEGVKIDYLTAPVHIGPAGVTCMRMRLVDADDGGRPRPEPVAGSEHSFTADRVIVAIGQAVDVPAASLMRARTGAVVADPQTLAASIRGIFAGGDAVLGPASIIEAIGHGRRAAAAMDRFLGGTGLIDRITEAEPYAEAPEASPPGTPRVAARRADARRRIAGFDLVEKGWDRSAALQEASRCLSCDCRSFEVTVNEAVCKGCGYCREVCGLRVYDRSDRFNAQGYRPSVAARPQRCVGCLRCLYICPDFAITVRTGKTS